MNVLYSEFPESVTVNGVEYPIVTDFRDWIKFCDLTETDEVNGADKALIMLDWYIEQVPPDLKKAILTLGEFLAAYPLYENNAGVTKSNSPQKAYSFSQDAGDIFSAFLTCYGIDLSTVDYLHWWKFRTLFDSLPNDCEIKQKMYYRTVDLAKIKNRDERKRIQELRSRIALKERKNRYVDDYDIGDVFG